MDAIKPIRTDEDYQRTVARIDALFDAEPGSPEDDELEVLMTLVESYDSKHFPMGYPTPLEALRFRMEQQGLEPRDLVPFLGSRSRVSEVLSGKRKLTLEMIRALHEHLQIPLESLIHEDSRGSELLADIRALPVSQMVRLGMLPSLRKGARSPEVVRRAVTDLVERSGGRDLLSDALFRKNDHARTNAKTDRRALLLWCCHVLATARVAKLEGRYRASQLTPEALKEIAQLSAFPDGPVRARAELSRRGIALVIAPHLPRTHLDGAALRLTDGAPVIGLTLRHDRRDNFWFCLLHELAHIRLHFDKEEPAAFLDDLELSSGDAREQEADSLAGESLVPRALWEDSEARHRPTALNVSRLAVQLHVDPAIVAGRVRHERKNFRLLTQLVGTGEVRRLFPEWRRS